MVDKLRFNYLELREKAVDSSYIENKMIFS